MVSGTDEAQTDLALLPDSGRARPAGHQSATGGTRPHGTGRFFRPTTLPRCNRADQSLRAQIPQAGTGAAHQAVSAKVVRGQSRSIGPSFFARRISDGLAKMHGNGISPVLAT